MIVFIVDKVVIGFDTEINLRYLLVDIGHLLAISMDFNMHLLKDG